MPRWFRTRSGRSIWADVAPPNAEPERFEWPYPLAPSPEVAREEPAPANEVPPVAQSTVGTSTGAFRRSEFDRLLREVYAPGIMRGFQTSEEEARATNEGRRARLAAQVANRQFLRTNLPPRAADYYVRTTPTPNSVWEVSQPRNAAAHDPAPTHETTPRKFAALAWHENRIKKARAAKPAPEVKGNAE